MRSEACTVAATSNVQRGKSDSYLTSASLWCDVSRYVMQSALCCYIPSSLTPRSAFYLCLILGSVRPSLVPPCPVPPHLASFMRHIILHPCPLTFCSMPAVCLPLCVSSLNTFLASAHYASFIWLSSEVFNAMFFPRAFLCFAIQWTFFFFFTLKGYRLRGKKLSIKKIPIVARPY